MSIDVSVVLPRLQFLHKCAGFVFSADDGFLEGLDDGRDFMLLIERGWMSSVWQARMTEARSLPRASILNSVELSWYSLILTIPP